MLSFDTSLVDVYLIAVLSLAGVALVLALGVVTHAAVRNRRARLAGHQSVRAYYGRLALHH